jgi:hypothetical protein
MVSATLAIPASNHITRRRNASSFHAISKPGANAAMKLNA